MDLVADGRRAFAGQAYAEAAALFESALAEGPADPAVVLLLARARFRSGDVGRAWEACVTAADLARTAGDAAALADAALVVRDIGPSPLVGRIHRLCVEALALLDGRDPDRARRLHAQLEATRSPWASGVEETAPDGTDPETRFLDLHARYSARLHVDHVEARLRLAADAIALGHACGDEEYTATGLFWRIEALAQLGRRVELDAEVAVLADVVAGLRQPLWTSRVALVRGCLFLLDGRFAECAAVVAAEPGFFGLVLRSELAVLTGEGLEPVEQEVRSALDGLPYFARGWHAQLLGALGRIDDAHRLWRAIAPHVTAMPRDSREWLIGVVGFAQICVQLGDVENAGLLHDLLEPYAHLHAVGSADGVSSGPVDLHLGRLAALLGRPEDARTHLTRALRSAEAIHALPHAALAHLELARLPGGPATERAAHESAAASAAAALGMAPLAAEVAALAAARSRSTCGPLSPRETEIAGLVADGLSNRAIAAHLTLSERTVENHVSHIMRKLERSTRAGVATWFALTAAGRPDRTP
ncbi:helix-turn-helix domain-containing protein [Pseudonocardia saturnea]